jgi:hypothetical protein
VAQFSPRMCRRKEWVETIATVGGGHELQDTVWCSARHHRVSHPGTRVTDAILLMDAGRAWWTGGGD